MFAMVASFGRLRRDLTQDGCSRLRSISDDNLDDDMIKVQGQEADFVNPCGFFSEVDRKRSPGNA
jgi:hypothetical protein